MLFLLNWIGNILYGKDAMERASQMNRRRGHRPTRMPRGKRRY